MLDGRGSDVYDMAVHYTREQQLVGAATPYYGWLYPPIFLFIATPLGLFRGIGLDPMLAFLAPEDEANAGLAALPSVIGGPV